VAAEETGNWPPEFMKPTSAAFIFQEFGRRWTILETGAMVRSGKEINGAGKSSRSDAGCKELAFSSFLWIVAAGWCSAMESCHGAWDTLCASTTEL
jgi:hypothetical protein